MSTVGHVSGIPVEEALPVLLSTGALLFASAQLALARVARRVRRRRETEEE